MSAVSIFGYGVRNGGIDLRIAPRTMHLLSRVKRPIQFPSSMPIIGLLGGQMAWSEAEKHAKYTNKVAHKETGASRSLGLVIPEVAHPQLAVAFRLPIEGSVTPAVTLRVDGHVWNAEACVFQTGALASTMISTFYSASVAALVELAGNAFAKVLAAPHKAASRLTYIRETNDEFMPDMPDWKKWAIASHWPDWRARRLALPACNSEFWKMNKEAFEDSRFRQMVSRMGLQISDNSDCACVTN